MVYMFKRDNNYYGLVSVISISAEFDRVLFVVSTRTYHVHVCDVM